MITGVNYLAQTASAGLPRPSARFRETLFLPSIRAPSPLDTDETRSSAKKQTNFGMYGVCALGCSWGKGTYVTLHPHLPTPIFPRRKRQFLQLSFH
jgi:hypothetical protein